VTGLAVHAVGVDAIDRSNGTVARHSRMIAERLLRPCRLEPASPTGGPSSLVTAPPMSLTFRGSQRKQDVVSQTVNEFFRAPHPIGLVRWSASK
jgi:hypothetical protein